MEMQNSLRLDLALLAKNHYGQFDDTVEAARLICAKHVLHNPAYFKHKDTLFWILKEFCLGELPIIPKDISLRILFDEIIDHNEWLRVLARDGGQDPGTTHRCIEALLSGIATIRVRDGETVLQPELVGQPDPQIVELLETTFAKGSKHA